MAAGQLSVGEAAERLGVTPQRLRALIRSGRLEAGRVGRTYVIDATSVTRLRESGRSSGRPLSAAGAWSLLALLADRPDEVRVPRATGYRLRALLVNEPDEVVGLLAGSQARSRRTRWRVLPGDLRVLHADPAVVSTGIAADDPLVDVRYQSDRDGFDGYVSEATLDRLQRRLRPIALSESANVSLRVPLGADWVLGEWRAPTAVVAADLLDARDPRLRRAGQQVLARLIRGD